MSRPKAGDVVRFEPGMSYYHDWLSNRFLIEPGAIGLVTNSFNPGFDKWCSVVFPPRVGSWEILTEELVVVKEGEDGTGEG